MSFTLINDMTAHCFIARLIKERESGIIPLQGDIIKICSILNTILKSVTVNIRKA